jgi:hypothetical protein
MSEKESQRDLEARKHQLTQAIQDLQSKIKKNSSADAFGNILERKLEDVLKRIKKKNTTIDTLESERLRVTGLASALTNPTESIQLKAIQDFLGIVTVSSEENNRDVTAEEVPDSFESRAPQESTSYDIQGVTIRVGDAISIKRKRQDGSSHTWTIKKFETMEGGNTRVYFEEEGGNKFSWLHTLQKEGEFFSVVSPVLESKTEEVEKKIEQDVEVGMILSFITENNEVDLLKIIGIREKDGIAYVQLETQYNSTGNWMSVTEDIPLNEILGAIATKEFSIYVPPQDMPDTPVLVQEKKDAERLPKIENRMYFLKEYKGKMYIYKIQKVAKNFIDFDATPLDAVSNTEWERIHERVELSEFEQGITEGNIFYTVRHDTSQRFNTAEEMNAYLQQRKKQKKVKQTIPEATPVQEPVQKNENIDPATSRGEFLGLLESRRINLEDKRNTDMGDQMPNNEIILAERSPSVPDTRLRPTKKEINKMIERLLRENSLEDALTRVIETGKSYISSNTKPEHLQHWDDEDIQSVISVLEQQLEQKKQVPSESQDVTSPNQEKRDIEQMPLRENVVQAPTEAASVSDLQHTPIETTPRRRIIDISPKELAEVLSSEQIQGVLKNIALATTDKERTYALDVFQNLFNAANSLESIRSVLVQSGYTPEEFVQSWRDSLAAEIFATFQSWIQNEMRKKIESSEYSFLEQLEDRVKAGFWEQAKVALKKNIPAVAIAVGGTAAIVASGGTAVVGAAISTGVAGMVRRWFSRNEKQEEKNRRNEIIEQNRSAYEQDRMTARSDAINEKLLQSLDEISSAGLLGMLAQGIREGSKVSLGETEEANVLLRKVAMLERAAHESREGDDQFELRLQHMAAMSSAKNTEAREAFLKQATNNPIVESLVQKMLAELGHTSNSAQNDSKIEMIRQYAVSALIGGTIGAAFATDSDMTRRILSGGLGAGYGYLYGAKLDAEARHEQLLADISTKISAIEQFFLSPTEESVSIDSDTAELYEKQIRGIMRIGLLDKHTNLRLRAEAIMREFDKEEEKSVFDTATLDTILEQIEQKNRAIETSQQSTATELLKKQGGWRRWAGLVGGGALGMLSGEVINVIKERLGIFSASSNESEDVIETRPSSNSEAEEILPDVSSTEEGATDVVVSQEVPSLPGEGLRAVVDRGQGAYHAVYKLMDQMSPAQKDEFVGTIAHRHPDWVERDASGQITNADRILRNWRREAVNSTRLETGEQVSVYNPATRAYGVRLHPNAEFSLQYDDNGYPILQLQGTPETGRYRILDEPVVRVVNTRGSSFVVESNAISPEESTVDITSESNASLRESTSNHQAPTPDMLTPDRDSATLLSTTLVESTHVVPQEATSNTLSSDNRDRFGITDEAIQAVVDDETLRIVPEETLTTQEETPTTVTDTAVVEPRRVQLASGRFIEFRYTENGDLSGAINADMSRISDQMLATPVRNREQLFATSDGDIIHGLRRNSMTLRLRQMYVYDEALKSLRSEGQQDTPEYTLLRTMYRNNMEYIARQKGSSVQDVFRLDVLREYGYRIEDEVPVTSEVVSDVRISDEVMERFRAASNDFSRVERNEMQVYIRNIQRLGSELSSLENRAERVRIEEQIQRLQASMEALLERVETRRQSS